MAFTNEMAVMTEFTQADVSFFQGNKKLLNEAGSTSTPAGTAHLRRCPDSHYVTHQQLEDHSVVSFCLGNYFFFPRRAVGGEEGVEETYAAGSELVNTKLQLLHAMRVCSSHKLQGFCYH